MPRPTIPPKAALKMFYVYDPGAGLEIGTFPVRHKDGHRIVMMTDAQANYWITTGTIGSVPLKQVAEGTKRSMLHQLSGGRIPTKEGGKPGTLKRNAVQNPGTMARALTEGYHPATGKLEGEGVTIADRQAANKRPRKEFR